MDDDDLDAFLAVARDDRREAPSHLLARVLADAHDLQPVSAPLSKPAPKRPDAFWFIRQWVPAGAFAGLATAALAGFWLGFAQPSALEWPGTQAPLDMVELIPSLDGWLTEG
ncbi:dihydroorotate dehydrogenase [Gemmobacter denitrificans]|uniref:Dihydroorotate dehydrogenase n=1 Tax=Gemmobacter denitrificans TaxID=3123040 RepID=A0ABU8BXL3_9RHOB